MIQIKTATLDDTEVLTQLGKTTFMEAHHTSASIKALECYLNKVYQEERFLEELENPNNIFHLIYFNEEPVGFSKITLSETNAAITKDNVTKLDRIYVLKEYYDKKLGVELFKNLVSVSKENKQTGLWLYVWVKNERAINFYKKMGFLVVGSYDFVLSKNKSNPNHIMFLEY